MCRRHISPYAQRDGSQSKTNVFIAVHTMFCILVLFDTRVYVFGLDVPIFCLFHCAYVIFVRHSHYGSIRTLHVVAASTYTYILTSAIGVQTLKVSDRANSAHTIRIDAQRFWVSHQIHCRQEKQLPLTKISSAGEKLNITRNIAENVCYGGSKRIYQHRTQSMKKIVYGRQMKRGEPTSR